MTQDAIDDLARLLATASARAGGMAEGAVALPDAFAGLVTGDPFSAGYAAGVRGLAEWMAGGAAPGSGGDGVLRLPFGTAVALLEAAAVQGAQAVLQLGGDGEVAMAMARLGARVVRGVMPGQAPPVLDGEAVRAGITVAPLDGVLDPARGGSEFDRVLVLGVLCGAADPIGMLGRLRLVLNPGGRLVFAAEPILVADDVRRQGERGALPYAWGPLVDGVSVAEARAGRPVRWAFRRELLVQALARLGFVASAVGGDGSGVLWAGASGATLELGGPMVMETLACPQGWYVGEGSHRWSRAAVAELPLDGAGGWLEGRLAVWNVLNLSRRVVVSVGAAREAIELEPLAECAVRFAMPPGPDPVLRIESAVTDMAAYAPNEGDARTLGVGVRWLEYGRGAPGAALEVEHGPVLRRAEAPTARADQVAARVRVRFGGEDLVIESDGSQTYVDDLAHWPAANAAFLAALEQVEEDATCLDIGANIGVTASLLARRARRGRVFAFEAVPGTADMLRRNLALNVDRDGAVEVVGAAMSDVPGTLLFRAGSNAAASHAVTAGYPGEAAGAISVPAVTIDGWAEGQAGLGRVGFIKIDVEGFEPNVLAGGARLIARDRPLILLELNAWCLNALHGYSPAAFVAALLRGYEVEVMGAGGRFVPMGDALAILHDNLIANHCVSDLLLRPRVGVALPGLAELVGVAAHLARPDAA